MRPMRVASRVAGRVLCLCFVCIAGHPSTWTAGVGNTSAQFTCAQMHDFGNCGQKFMLNSVKELPEGECQRCTTYETDPGLQPCS